MSTTWIIAAGIGLGAVIVVLVLILVVMRALTLSGTRNASEDDDDIFELTTPAFIQNEEESRAASISPLPSPTPSPLQSPAPPQRTPVSARPNEAPAAPDPARPLTPSALIENETDDEGEGEGDIPQSALSWGLRLIGLSVGASTAHLSWSIAIRNAGEYPIPTLYVSSKIIANRPGEVQPEDIVMEDFRIDTVENINLGETINISGLWEFPSRAVRDTSPDGVHLYGDIQLVGPNIPPIRQTVIIGSKGAGEQPDRIRIEKDDGIITGLIARPPA